MPVSHGFFERNVNVVAGQVDLASAHVGDLADDLAGWLKRGPSGEDRLRLNGFTYDRISGAATDAPSRLNWLSRGDHSNSVFHPQPYQQIGRVPGAMGHAWDRRLVLMARERLQRQGVPGCTLPGWPKRWVRWVGWLFAWMALGGGVVRAKLACDRRRGGVAKAGAAPVDCQSGGCLVFPGGYSGASGNDAASLL